MTTAVTVNAHAGWPVEIVTIDTFGDVAEPQKTEYTVQPHEERTFYVHSTMSLTIRELPMPGATNV